MRQEQRRERSATEKGREGSKTVEREALKNICGLTALTHTSEAGSGDEEGLVTVRQLHRLAPEIR